MTCDRGGQSHHPFTTETQLNVAQAMGVVLPDFVVAVGDNFYKDGVDDVMSKRFTDTYDDVYSGMSLQVPWYVIAGNHDHKGSVAAQIQYTAESSRWNFPDYFYTFNYSFVSTTSGRNLTAQFVMIDTVLLSGSLDDEDDEAAMPSDVDPVLAATQWQWIQSTLASSTADWLIVAGHYPVWSVGNHGPTADLVQHLDPLLKKYGVSLYLCGHEHNVEFLRGSLDYIVTGAGHSLEYSKKTQGSLPASVQLRFYYPPNPNFADGDGMFTFMQIFDENTLNTTYYDVNGNGLTTITTPNQRNGMKK